MIARILLAACSVLLAGAASAAPLPAVVGSVAPACPYGSSAVAFRAEAYCAGQLALRSTIARSLGLLEARTSAGEGAFADDLRRAQDLRSQREALTAAEREARGESGGDAAKARLRRIAGDMAAVDTALAAVEARIASQHPQWLELARPAPLSEYATRALLRPGELLLFWFATEDAAFVWAIGRDGADWARIPIGERALGTRVAALREGLGVDGPARAAIASAAPHLAFDRAAAADLYRTLFPGRIGQRAMQARSLLLVPTGSLTSLPFAALPTGETSWLGLAKPLAILPAPNSLRALRSNRTARAPEPFAGYGAPLLAGAPAAAPAIGAMRGGLADLAGIRALPSLPQTEGELHQLARALHAPATAVHVGAAATEQAVKGADLARYRILAFATHGLLPGEADGVDEAGLVFTPPARASEQDDGILTASEAAQLKLSADWVILSACSTAAGGRRGAESLSGLASAFTYAGARALLVSQWRVEDAAARRLTTLAVSARGVDRAEALRRAMAAVAGDPGHPGWADPSIWAVFELVGDPRGS